MDEKDEFLIRVLAYGDAPYLPERTYERDSHVTTFEARKQIAEFGVRLWGGGVDAGRKADQRLREAMEKDGRITLVRPSGQKVILCRLVYEVQWHLRGLCGTANFEDALISVQELDRLEGHPDQGEADEGGWISERTLSGCEYDQGDYRRQMGIVQWMMLPALMNGWAATGSSCQGHAWYRLTDKGRKLIARSEHPELAYEIPEELPEAVALYEEFFKQEQTALKVRAPRDKQEIGPCPLPVSMPTRGSRAKYDAIYQAKRALENETNGHDRGAI